MEPTVQQEALVGVAMVGIIMLSIVIGLAIAAVVCFFLYKLYKAVPEEHRQLSPGLVWLLMIPLFNVVWNFFVFPKLSRSYQTWFESRGDTSAGTCNSGLAWAYAVLVACTLLAFIPCIGWLVPLAALVVLIIYLVKMFDLKNRATTSPPPAPETPPVGSV